MEQFYSEDKPLTIVSVPPYYRKKVFEIMEVDNLPVPSDPDFKKCSKFVVDMEPMDIVARVQDNMDEPIIASIDDDEVQFLNLSA